MSKTSLELREGDVYQFRYSPDQLAKRFAPHHCFDGQVVVWNGKLCDTYWAGYRLSSGGEMRVVKPEEGTLEFVCNLNDVHWIDEYQVRYYADSDVFNLSYQHGCTTHFVVRNGATRSADKMLAWIRAKRAAIKSEIECALTHLESLSRQEARVEVGDTEVSIG